MHYGRYKYPPILHFLKCIWVITRDNIITC